MTVLATSIRVGSMFLLLSAIAFGQGGGRGPVNREANVTPVPFERILHAKQEPQNWLTYSGQAEPAPQRAHADHAGERQGSHAQVGVPIALAREARSHAAGGRRRYVHGSGHQRRLSR